jgi:hypothetical protein
MLASDALGPVHPALTAPEGAPSIDVSQFHEHHGPPHVRILQRHRKVAAHVEVASGSPDPESGEQPTKTLTH